MMVKSTMQQMVALSVTEAETIVAVSCANDMLHVMRIIQALDLEVELSIILKVKNSGVVNIANSWTSGGRTRHMDVCLNSLKN